MILSLEVRLVFFFFNDTATTEIYTLSLHDALPIFAEFPLVCDRVITIFGGRVTGELPGPAADEASLLYAMHGLVSEDRSEEHTSELQSRQYLVCRLLLEKKKKRVIPHLTDHSIVAV